MKVAPIFFVLSSVFYTNILFLINDLITAPQCDQNNITTKIIHGLILMIIIRILDTPENFKSNLTYGYY